MNADWAPSGFQPSDQANRLGLWVCLYAATIYTHRHHLLLLLSPKADTHFTILQRVEGWVDLVHYRKSISIVHKIIVTATPYIIFGGGVH